MEKVRGIYPVRSNKTVRAHEPYVKTWRNKRNGILQHTNRGYFLDGKNISGPYAKLWLQKNESYCKIHVYRAREAA